MSKFRLRVRPPYAVLIGLAFLVAAAAGTSAAFAYAYRDRMYPGVRVAGTDVSGLGRAEAEARIAAKSATYGRHRFKVTVPDVSRPVAGAPGTYEDTAVDATAADLGLGFNVAAAVDAAWERGRARSFLATLLGGYDAPLGYAVDRSKVKEFVTAKVLPAAGAPVPARITVNGTEISVSPSVQGISVDAAKLEGELVSALANASDTDVTYLRAPVSPADASVTVQTVQPLADTLDAIGNAPVSLKAGSTTLKPTRSQLLSWYTPSQGDDGRISLVVAQEQVGTYLKSQSAVDSGKSLDILVKALGDLAGETVEQLKKPVSVALAAAPPKTVDAGTAFTPNLAEGKYVEVDLSSQRLYAVDTDRLVKAYVVSSGKWSTPTPTGTFHIISKSPRAYSRSFGLYMPYWENFLDGEYGLHELPEWPNGYKEGQSHLGTPVSHGCVRLGVGDAKEVYDWTEIGTPVIIHA